MDQLKSHFKGFAVWGSIEANLAMLCADLNEPTNDMKKKELIKALRNIVKFLTDKGIELEDTTFLKDEIDRYKFTRQISLYVEKEDYILEKLFYID